MDRCEKLQGSKSQLYGTGSTACVFLPPGSANFGLHETQQAMKQSIDFQLTFVWHFAEALGVVGDKFLFILILVCFFLPAC